MTAIELSDGDRFVLRLLLLAEAAYHPTRLGLDADRLRMLGERICDDALFLECGELIAELLGEAVAE